ncbi:fatty acyl-CoA reductase 1-like [Uranotaenia lowii]|uniref:fatty acyl-CoA reductase 1-like n=1 Tax=Uranotaenia lowii TaxID=190385 RepID=UPI0024792589|nr:fatty acyl-CoA reductase 1-like [Uranotaenia lowii]XP_055608043.1 fatty acyl-CoA reductase 1-like [Uranotaenia lowii]XP_055608053.1 fatty acyl-CoA reductase 1-like [Uranotaenia lowii]
MDLPIMSQVESIANRFHSSLKSSTVGIEPAVEPDLVKPTPVSKVDFNNNTVKSVAMEPPSVRQEKEEEFQWGHHFEIRPFYDGKNIFVTGGTGFLGKVLIEKLLRSCDGVKKIYVLLRPKRGLTSEQRYREFVKHPVFDKLRATMPTVLDKMVYIGGDITQPSLGLSEKDRQLLLETVNIVFHVAATVRFNEGLKEAAVLNAIGTQRMLDLCVKMFNLQSVVHVSTAYSNPCRKVVDEVVYEPTMNADSFIQCVNVLPADIINTLADKLQGDHPNTYTLTKSIAEQLVSEYSSQLPICIVRPSIVTGAWKEPYPGWVDNVYGITGIMMEIGRGTISSIMCDQKCVMDVIPVDIVCNTLIAAAWENAMTMSNPIRVYNCTSGSVNPIKWYRYGEITTECAIKNPTKYVMLYPWFQYRTNRLMHKIVEVFLHFLPAYVFDVLMRLQGSKPIMAKIAKRFQKAADTGEFFAMHEWNFQIPNLKRLTRKVRLAKDGMEFNVDIANLSWDRYIENYMLGIRKFVLKDDLDSMEQARSKVQKLFWFRTFVQIAIVLLLGYFFLKIFF